MKNSASPLERDFLLDNIFAAGVNTTNAIHYALELARVQALTKGKYTAKTSGGGKDTVYDYKLDKSQNIGAVDFSDDSFDPIQYLMDAVNGSNYELTRGLLSKKGYAALLSNEQVIKRVLGSNATVHSVLPSQLEQFLTAQGLPLLMAYKGSYATKDEKGNVITKSFIDDDAFSLFGDGKLGDTVYGVTPEESSQINDGANVSNAGNIMLTAFTKQDPIENIILATSMATVTLAQRNQMLIGKVLK